MSMKLIMENFRSFSEGEQAYQKYLDMTGDEKEKDSDRDGMTPEEEAAKEAEAEKVQKGDAFEYTSKSGKESAVQVVDPENKHGATVAQKIDPESCEPQKNSQFASNPDKFAAAVGDPIDQCDADGGGDSKIANIISQKLKSSGIDKYIMKITKRDDLLELEKVILNLALDSSSPIKAADLLKVVTQLKADIQAKVKGAKSAKGAKEG